MFLNFVRNENKSFYRKQYNSRTDKENRGQGVDGVSKDPIEITKAQLSPIFDHKRICVAGGRGGYFLE